MLRGISGGQKKRVTIGGLRSTPCVNPLFSGHGCIQLMNGCIQLYGSLYLSTLFFALVHMMFNGFSEMSITVAARLPVLHKQRDNLFYPGWAFSLPSWILRLPYSVVESVIWSCIVYFIVGLAPEAGRFFRYMFLLFLMHQMAIGLFRLIGALGRTMVVANTFGSFALLVVFVLGGFILARQSMHPWWIWGYWISPLSYAQNAIAVNEFLAPRWQKIRQITGRPLYLSILESRGIFTRGYWYRIGIGAMIAYTVLFNVLATLALQHLNPMGKQQATVAEETVKEKVSGCSMSTKRKSMSVRDGLSSRNGHSARNGHRVEGMQMEELSRVQQNGVPSETAVQDKDYYATLGVNKNDSKADIKSAYRKLARQFHPDVNKDPGAEQKFKDISNAYEDGAGR